MESRKLVVQGISLKNNKFERYGGRVYLHVDNMKEYKLCAGDYIVIKKYENEGKEMTVGIAWPSFTIQKNYIQLSTVQQENSNLQIEDIATVSRIDIPIIIASKIVLEPCDNIKFPIDQMLNIYAKEILRNRVEFQYHGHFKVFRVIEIKNNNVEVENFDIFSITRDTIVVILPKKKEEAISKVNVINENISKFGYANIGGLSEQIQIIREMVEVPLKNPELFVQFGLRPPKGILLHGPPGTGKTLIARAVAEETSSYVICVNGPEIMSKYYGETETKLKDLFNQAVENAPSIIFIDEIDALCPKHIGLQDRVVIIGATNRPNALDEALRRPGRFDRELEIGIPNSNSRCSILSTLLRNTPHTLSSEDINELAAKLHGYVGADLAALCREAGLRAIKKSVENHNKQNIKITINDMNDALKEIRPSAMREIVLEVPKVYWSDIGGQQKIKQKLKESIEWPLQHPEKFSRLGIRPPKGILLYGPPGCSKTLMAKALATEAGLNFIAVKGPELFSKWVGESEKAVREVFRKARAASPSIIFFDEIDALTVKRGAGEGGGTSVVDRVLSQLLNELDGIEPLVNVTIVAATNRPDIIDNALLRPGRIDRILYVGPPDQPSRKEIFSIQLRKMSCGKDVYPEELASMTEGYSGAEIVAISQEAALYAMEEDLDAKEVLRDHFIKAISSFTRRITTEMIEFYEDFRKKSGLKSV
ncbi:7039_t:CDS:10 [Diversispora eburnea]|uniref:7039_t:CDS:1 n=1 Tax=Diversispora eburnea TaxID=1213867 RepID=A0A9N9B273_9GLOM|nr:7039_t:CDS:10 [Diversispora eburnea]